MNDRGWSTNQPKNVAPWWCILIGGWTIFLPLINLCQHWSSDASSISTCSPGYYYTTDAVDQGLRLRLMKIHIHQWIEQLTRNVYSEGQWLEPQYREIRYKKKCIRFEYTTPYSWCYIPEFIFFGRCFEDLIIFVLETPIDFFWTR